MNFWEKDIETLSRERLEAQQAEDLKNTLRTAFKTEFYKKRFAEFKLKSPEEVASSEDFRKLPFTTKDDLRVAYPYGLLAEPLEKVVRLHASSGTTGTPTVIYHTQGDLDAWTNLVARSLIAAGATKKDVFQNMMTYGLFTGGLGLHYGAERIGMMVIPTGGGNTMRQYKFMQDFKTTILHITPSYLLHIHDKMEEHGVARSSLSLKKAIVGGEPHSEDMRQKLQRLLGIDVYNCYGLSELNGPGVAFECEDKSGMHLWEDNYILEIIDPDTGRLLPDGEVGELVLTTLKRTATPLLRYRTRDPYPGHPRRLRLRPNPPQDRPHHGQDRRHAHHQRRQRLSLPDRRGDHEDARDREQLPDPR